MYYQDPPSNELRFGDIITGLLFTAPNLDEPHLNLTDCPHNLSISIPVFSVVMTPCCSIEDRTISVTPLTKIPPQVFCTEAIQNDPLIINQKMKQVDSIYPQQYDNLKPNERKIEPVYGQLNYFIYEESEYFPPYDLTTRDRKTFNTGKYAIDFKDVYRINCKKVQSNKQSPIELKRLELTPFTRSDLRYKMANYYGRATDGDAALLGEL